MSGALPIYQEPFKERIAAHPKVPPNVFCWDRDAQCLSFLLFFLFCATMSETINIFTGRCSWPCYFIVAP